MPWQGPFLSKSAALALTLTGGLALAPAADAYPIDCAILLCLAGGFPASAECTAARAEMIRRITPFPIEPPLQLWRCPMGSGAAGISMPSIGPDGLDPTSRQIRDGVGIYHVRYWRRKSHDDLTVSDSTRVGAYDINGKFYWKPAELIAAPDWVYVASDISRDRIEHESGSFFIRGIAIVTHDYAGNATTEWVRY